MPIPAQPRTRRPWRTRSLVTIASACLAATALPPSPASAADALPTSVQACQAMFDSKNDTTWRAADGNITVTLPNGKLVWLFGDTLRKDRPAVHNSILVQEGSRLTSTTGGQALPNESDGDYYWPTDAIVDGGLLRAFVGRVETVNGSFQGRGVALATFTLDSRGYPIYSGKRTITTASEDAGVQWGTSVVRDGSTVYVFGQQRRLGDYLFGRDAYLAKVPAGSLSDLSAWRYRSGTGWTSDRSQATRIEAAETGRFSSSFSVDKVGGKWVVTSKENDFVGDKIIRMEAPYPWGPFKTTSSISTPGTATEWAYQPKGHPELALGTGRLLVTWNEGSSDTSLLADTYFPKPKCGEVG